MVLVVGGGIFWLTSRTTWDARTTNGSSPSASNSAYPFQVGNPGPGQSAPALVLPSTDGSTFDLAKLRGKTVLLYFQEGISCQPCWDQMKDMQTRQHDLRALGIETMVSITTNPLNALTQKVADEGLSMPVLSDTSLAVSRAYHANEYGMMGESSDGHTFIMVGPDGRILWRADYGGAPNYTMYVPMDTLLTDLRAGLKKA